MFVAGIVIGLERPLVLFLVPFLDCRVGKSILHGLLFNLLSLAICYFCSYCSIVVSEDVAHTCISSLGSLGVIQFVDLNSSLTPFQRRYVAFLKRIDELDRKFK